MSHSLANLQNTDLYFKAECVTFESFYAREGMTRVDLLKLDVEGAEHSVLRSVLVSKVLPKVICVEFDEGVHRPEGYFQRITSTIQALRGAGYLLGKVDRWNLTFLRPDRTDLALPRGKPRAVSGQSSRSG